MEQLLLNIELPIHKTFENFIVGDNKECFDVLKNFILPVGLINSINDDPESQSFYYIFSAIPHTNLTSRSRKSIYQFLKSVTE